MLKFPIGRGVRGSMWRAEWLATKAASTALTHFVNILNWATCTYNPLQGLSLYAHNKQEKVYAKYLVVNNSYTIYHQTRNLYAPYAGNSHS